MCVCVFLKCDAFERGEGGNGEPLPPVNGEQEREAVEPGRRGVARGPGQGETLHLERSIEEHLSENLLLKPRQGTATVTPDPSPSPVSPPPGPGH